MDTDWTRDLTPMRHKQPLMPSMRNKASITAREAVELLKLKRALEAKAKRLLTPRSASALLPEKSIFL